MISKKSPITIGLTMAILSMLGGGLYAGSLYVDAEIKEALEPVAQQVSDLKDTLETQRKEQRADMQAIYSLILQVNNLEAKELNGGTP